MNGEFNLNDFLNRNIELRNILLTIKNEGYNPNFFNQHNILINEDAGAPAPLPQAVAESPIQGPLMGAFVFRAAAAPVRVDQAELREFLRILSDEMMMKIESKAMALNPALGMQISNCILDLYAAAVFG